MAEGCSTGLCLWSAAASSMQAFVVLEGLELLSFSYHPALFLVAGPVFFLCLPYFSQSALCGGVVICFRCSIPNLVMESPGWSCAASNFFITSHTADSALGVPDVRGKWVEHWVQRCMEVSHDKRLAQWCAGHAGLAGLRCLHPYV
eukprot:1156413-Pelagomonas_calceolata.AAC.1